MTTLQIAEMINGREYGNEITKEIQKLMADNRICAVFGSSDDNFDMFGYFRYNQGSYGGATVKLNKNGVVENLCDSDTCPHYIQEVDSAKNTINAIWCKDGYSWVIESDIPFATFDILEDGEKFCRGIVFNVDDLK